ncbi:MAG: DUF1292 domain-containing protein [Bacilli bacterium]|nr:DUF1292 domain-containing protein [Bacilli bacterium]
MKNKIEVVKVRKDGKDAVANILNCFELDNGKTYVLYSIDGEEGVYASSLYQTPSEILLDDVSDEEMNLIVELLKKANKEEV